MGVGVRGSRTIRNKCFSLPENKRFMFDIHGRSGGGGVHDHQKLNLRMNLLSPHEIRRATYLFFAPWSEEIWEGVYESQRKKKVVSARN